MASASVSHALLPALRLAAKLMLAVLLASMAVSSASAREVPDLKGLVNDYARLLSSATISQLETVLAALESTDSTQIAVLTIDSLNGDSLEDFSLRTVEKWKIGQKQTDNGALLLISRDDRLVRIEVGYGLEGSLTDMVSGQIIRNIITPNFRRGDFNQGVIDGVGAMISAVRGEFQAPADGGQQAAGGDDGDLGGLLTSLIFIFFFFGSMFRKNRLFAAAIGGIVSPLVGFFLFGISGLALLALLFFGIVGGLIASSMASTSTGRRSSGRSGGFYLPTGGGFGGSSGGFGGFSGGGGGFGGGGASGGW